MFQKLSFVAVVAVGVLLPERVFAGGPPWLNIPIDGVTAENVQACTELLASKLDHKRWQHAGSFDDKFRLLQYADQWYLTFFMGEDVALSEVERALKGSEFSIPRDRLHMFGHVILEIDARDASPQKLVSDLDGLEYVSIEESQPAKDRFLVTVNMPYPVQYERPNEASLDLGSFQWNDFASDQSVRSQPEATARMLPSLDAFRALVEKHGASLEDIRWSVHYACRAQGSVAVSDSEVAATSAVSATNDN
jgi:hypothetical protein